MWHCQFDPCWCEPRSVENIFWRRLKLPHPAIDTPNRWPLPHFATGLDRGRSTQCQSSESRLGLVAIAVSKESLLFDDILSPNTTSLAPLRSGRRDSNSIRILLVPVIVHYRLQWINKVAADFYRPRQIQSMAAMYR